MIVDTNLRHCVVEDPILSMFRPSCIVNGLELEPSTKFETFNAVIAFGELALSTKSLSSKVPIKLLTRPPSVPELPFNDQAELATTSDTERCRNTPELFTVTKESVLAPPCNPAIANVFVADVVMVVGDDNVPPSRTSLPTKVRPFDAVVLSAGYEIEVGNYCVPFHTNACPEVGAVPETERP